MTSSAEGPEVTTEFLALQEAVAGRYSLVRELGRGGSAIVFLARDAALDRLVAIKLLREDLVADPRARDRFLDEARTAARLHHPHIVPVHAVEEAEDLVFLVMAHVDGESLGHRVRRAGPLSPAAVRQVVREVAWALAAAHEAGVVHMDVKPDNILLERGTGRALLTDFGVARLRAAGTGADGSGREAPSGEDKELAGTPRYMSPEQLAGASVDGRSDLYSLGVTAYFALTASWPGVDTAAGPSRRLGTRGDASGNGPESTSRALATAIDRCLAVDRDDRPPSAVALAAEVGEADAVPFSLPYRARKLVYDLRQFVWMSLGGALALVIWPEPALLIGAVTALFVFGSYGGSARALLRDGYDPELLRTVMLEEVRGLFTGREGSGGSWWGRLWDRFRTGLIRAGPALTALGVAGVAAAWLFRPDLPLWGITAAAALLGTLLMGAGPAAPEGSPLRHLDWAERMLAGRFGRTLFWLSGTVVPLPAARSRRMELPQPTEVVLARASRELFQALPEAARERFSELPEVAGRLERQVEVLRDRERDLTELLARVDLSAGDDGEGRRRDAKQELEEERARVEARLREAVAALEYLRLSLSRLASDATAPRLVELEGDLARAREVEQTARGAAGTRQG